VSVQSTLEEKYVRNDGVYVDLIPVGLLSDFIVGVNLFDRRVAIDGIRSLVWMMEKVMYAQRYRFRASVHLLYMQVSDCSCGS
jgi:hypothetical protein